MLSFPLILLDLVPFCTSKGNNSYKISIKRNHFRIKSGMCKRSIEMFVWLYYKAADSSYVVWLYYKAADSSYVVNVCMTILQSCWLILCCKWTDSDMQLHYVYVNKYLLSPSGFIVTFFFVNWSLANEKKMLNF